MSTDICVNTIDPMFGAYKTIKLYGHLGEKFGKVFKADADSPAQVIFWLCAQVKGFREVFNKGKYAILRGGKAINHEDELGIRFGSCDLLEIVPEFCGEKSAGIGKFILGFLLLASVVVTLGASGAFAGAGMAAFGGSLPFAGITYGSLALLGGTVMLAGLYQMLSPVPKVGDGQNRERADQRASFLLNQIVNTTEEGSPVPIVVGRKMRIGTKVVSAGVVVAQTPLDELITSQVDAEDNIKLWAYQKDLTPLRFRGRSNLHFYVNGDEYTYPSDYAPGETPGPYGSVQFARVNNALIQQVGVQRTLSPNGYQLHVVLSGTLPQDHFDVVTFTSQDEQTEYVQKIALTADEFEAGVTRKTWSRAGSMVSYYMPARVTRWTWDLAGWPFDATVDGNTWIRAIFGYSI